MLSKALESQHPQRFSPPRRVLEALYSAGHEQGTAARLISNFAR